MLYRLPIHARHKLERLDIGDLVHQHQRRAAGREGVERLPGRPLARQHLDIARADIVEGHCARDIRERRVGGDLFAAPADHHRQLGLVVDLLADARQDDRAVGTGQRVAELREEDRHLGHFEAGLGRVLAIVQPEADNLVGIGDGWTQAHASQRARSVARCG